MITPESFYRSLINSGIGFFSGVPDSLLKNFCAYLQDHCSDEEHVIAANEGNAVAMGIGYHLASNKVPLIYLQNSGLGNVINPLLSLADPKVYGIPMVLLIGWRGEPGVQDEPQHVKQGCVTESLLETMGVPCEKLTPDMDDLAAHQALKSLVQKTTEQKRPGALLVSKGTFDAYVLQKKTPNVFPLFREQAIQCVVNELSENDIIVATTGVTSRELFEYRASLKQGHDTDFLTVGGMGHASQIALGIALQKKDRQVICLDGDGAMLMHMGAMAINAASCCENLKHIIINNGAHDSVGGQPTVTMQIDILNLATALGYSTVLCGETEADIKQQIRSLREVKGPALLEIKTKRGFRKNLGRPTQTPVQNKNELMKRLN